MRQAEGVIELFQQDHCSPSRGWNIFSSMNHTNTQQLGTIKWFPYDHYCHSVSITDLKKETGLTFADAQKVAAIADSLGRFPLKNLDS